MSSRISALQNAIEQAIKSGMSKKQVEEICKTEMFGAARLRAAVQECMAPDKVVPISFYDRTVDKKIPNEGILEAVKTAVQGEKP